MKPSRSPLTVWTFPYPIYLEGVHELQKQFPERLWQAERPPNFYRRMEAFGRQFRAPWTPLTLFPATYAEIGMLARRGWLKPLTSLMSPQAVKQIAPAALAACSVEGIPYAFPEDATPYALIAHRGLLARRGLAPAATWEALKEQLRYLRRRSGGVSIGVAGGAPNHLLGFLFGLLGSNGIDPRRGLDAVLARTKELGEAFEWVREMVRANLLIAPARPHKKDEIGIEDLRRGRVPYYFAWPGRLAKWPAAELEQISITPFPRGPSGKNAFLPLQGHGWCVPHNAVVMDVAFEALRAFVAPAFQKRCELAGGQVFPVRTALWRDREILAAKPVYRCAPSLLNTTPEFALHLPDRDGSNLERQFHAVLEKDGRGADWIAQARRLTEGLPVPAISHPQIRKVLAYAEANIEKVQTIRQAAALAGLSPTHFRRLFRQEAGESWGACLRRRRMEKARALLADLTLQMKEIAFGLGFRSTSYFTQAFRAYWRKSPTHMRKEDLKKLQE